MARKSTNKINIDGLKENSSTGRNCVPNYKKGVRRKITSILLYAGILDFKHNDLLSDNHRSVLTKLALMEQEGLVFKSSSPNGTYVGLCRKDEDIYDVWKTYFSEDLIDYYNSHSKVTAYRVNSVNDISEKNGGDKKKAFSILDRSFFLSQLCLFVDGIGVDYIPGGYDYTSDTINAPVRKKASLKSNEHITNAFYSIYELQDSYSLALAIENLRDIDDVASKGKNEAEKEELANKISSSRALGILFLGDTPYITYAFSRSIGRILYGPESNLKTHIDFHLLSRRKMADLNHEIIFYEHDSVIKRLLAGNKELVNTWYANLATDYDNALFIPTTKNGQDLCKIMMDKNWEEKLLYIVCLRRLIKLLPLDNKLIDADGYFINKKDNTKRYILLFTVPNMERLLRFAKRAAESYDEAHKEKDESKELSDSEIKESYEVLCFDFQEGALTDYAKKNHFVLNSINFHTLTRDDGSVTEGVYEAYKNANSFN